MLSKLVADREKSARTVGAAFETHREALALKLGALLEKELKPGEVLPDISLVLRLLQRGLGRAAEHLIQADLAHSSELRDDVKPRQRRDEAAAKVLEVTKRTRLALTDRFGRDFGGLLGSAGAAPKAGNEILSWGRQFAEALKAAELPELAAEDEDSDEVSTFSREVALSKLQARLTTLERCLNEVARENREAESTQVVKSEATEHYDRTFLLTSRLLEALFDYVGESTLAAKVRPSLRRPGQVSEVTEVADTEGPDHL